MDLILFVCYGVNRLARFDKRNWRIAYNSLIVVEHLLTHGPESVSDEFQGDIDVISQMQTFQQIDEKGYLILGQNMSYI